MIDTIATFALGAMAGFAVTACLAHVVIREAMSAQLESDMRSLRDALIGQRIAPLAPTDFVSDPVKAEEAYLQ